MSRFDKIIGDSLTIGYRQAIGLLLTVLQTLFAAKFLGPDGFGTYALVSILALMAAVGNFGFLGAAARELPHYRSNGEPEKERAVLNHVVGGELITSLAWVIVIVVAGLIQSSSQIQTYLILIAMAAIPSKLVSVYQLMAYTDKNFELQSRIELIRVTVTSLLVMSTVWTLHMYAVLLAPIIGSGVAILAYKYKYNSLAIDWRGMTMKEYIRLAKIGLPIAGLAVVSGNNGLQRWGERWLIGSYLGIAALGVYAFFVWITLAILSVFGSLIQALQPHIYELMSKELSEDEINRYLIKPIWAVCVSAMLVIGAGVVFLPDIVQAFLPEYASGLPIMAVLLFATLLSCFFWLPAIILQSVRFNGQFLCLVTWTVAVAASIFLSWVMIYNGFGLLAVAVGYAMSQLIVLTVFFWYVRKFLFSAAGSFKQLLTDLAFPLVNIAGAIVCLHFLGQWLLPELTGKFELLASGLARGILFCVITLPTLLLWERRTKIYSKIIRKRLEIFS